MGQRPDDQKAMNSRLALNLIALLAFLFIASVATSNAQTLTINDGSGSGPHVPGELVTVTADPPPPGQMLRVGG
jgi:hypothetical protein